MDKLMRSWCALFILCGVLMPFLLHAQEAVCTISDRDCVLEMIGETANNIKEESWRDQTLRELAKTYAFEGEVDKAISEIDRITNPDTKAMTIRGIGMALAAQDVEQEAYDAAFKKLDEAAEKIGHPPSHAIALTYIAMSHAFAGQDQKAWDVAASMENEALRNKAYGETAEIQAEFGHFDEAMISISKIESEAYRNKAYSTISKILADGGLYDNGIAAAMEITNPYKKAKALQYVLDQDKPRDVERTSKE